MEKSVVSTCESVMIRYSNITFTKCVCVCVNQLPAQPSDNFDKRQLMESEGIKGVGLLHAHTHT